MNKPGQDGDVEARDGDDVGGAGIPVGLLEIGRQAVIVPEQDAGQQGSFRVGEDLVELGHRLIPEAIDQVQERISRR